MPRSIDWIVAALGVLRLGAAYIPLDCSWPDPRLRFALKDSGAKAVVAERPMLDRLKCGIPEIDILDDAWRALPDARPSFNAVQPNDVAYVIYTSGSTGNPKGVEITHANLSHLVNWHLKDFHLTRKDRTSHLASLGFDAAVWEIWPTLCAGATLCIAGDPVRLSNDLLQNWLINEQITVSFVPTIQATALIDKKWPSQTALRFMLTGADVLSRGPHKRIPFVLVNNYGPTECTVVASSGPVTVGSDQIPTIGKSIRGAAIYILDIDAQPVPDGELGEIYIGGAGVGRGYRNLPDETQFAFLPDPFSFVSGARMYKTGDLGVRRSNGEIEFRGRIDRQVKINGKRVELSEIDSVLARHQDLSFATTQARIGSQGEIRLIAYVVARSSEVALSADQLRAHLSQALPSYMVPAHFVRLPSIPLLSNGKLDQNALEMGSPFDLGAGIMSVRQSQLGDRLLVVVQDLLKHPGLSKEDDFFLAGGHSLFGMQLILHIEEEFGADLSLQQILENPTVNRLSAEIEWVLDPSRKDAAPSLERNSPAPSPHSHSSATHRDTTFRNPRLLPSMNCAHASKVRPLIQMNGLPRGVAALQPNTHRRTIFWIHYVHGNLARAVGDEYGFFVIRLALEDFGEMDRWPSAQAIARAMIKKILQVQPAGPFVIGGMCLGGVLAYEIASQLRTAGHEVSLLILADAFNPRDRSGYRSIGDLVSRAKYVLERARKLGVQETLDSACKGLIRKLPRSLRRTLAKNQVEKTQEIVESASLSYRPAPYTGPVLMILASDCSPHKRTEQGWRGLLDGSLTIASVDGHHSELTQSPAVDQIAQAILSHPVFAPADVKQDEPEKSLDFARN
jgi:amino acid adenylation domain-containing protein